MQNFKDLKVWEKAHILTLSIYKLSGIFPKEEVYGLTSQMRRSSASISTNIAEGCGRGSNPDFARFLQISMGSACELEYQILLAKDLGYTDLETYQSLNSEVESIKRMLTALIRKITEN